MGDKNVIGGTTFVAFAITVSILAALGCGLWAPPGWDWILVLVAMFAFLLLSSCSISGRPLGFLIDERNLMSLSRFQMALWTLLLLSAYWTMSLKRIAAGLGDPLAIQLDWRLWALMGISTTSLVGSPLVLGTKMHKEPADAKRTLAAAETALKEPATEIDANRRGTLYANKELKDARLTDMFQGDELGNTAHLDLAKIQMFLFTIVAVLSYAVLLFQEIRTISPDKLISFPSLSEGFLALLGISHGGYLTNKAVDHTPVAR